MHHRVRGHDKFARTRDVARLGDFGLGYRSVQGVRLGPVKGRPCRQRRTPRDLHGGLRLGSSPRLYLGGRLPRGRLCRRRGTPKGLNEGRRLGVYTGVVTQGFTLGDIRVADAK